MSTHGHFIQLQNQTSSLNTIKAGINTLNGHNDEVETKLDSVITNGTSTNTKLDTFSGHINNTTAIGDGSTQLRVVPLGYNQSAGQARSLLCDAAGHQQIDVVSSALPSGGATEAKQDVMETTLTAIETDIAALEVLQTATNTKLDTVATNTANIKISTDSVNLNVDTLETLQTSTNTKLDTLETSNQAIKTAVEIIDNAISGSEMQVDIVSSALPSGAATEATLSAAEVHLGNIETSVQLLDDVVKVDDASVTLGSQKGLMLMGYAGANSVNSGDAALLSCNTTGQLNTNVVNSVNVEIHGHTDISDTNTSERIKCSSAGSVIVEQAPFTIVSTTTLGNTNRLDNSASSGLSDTIDMNGFNNLSFSVKYSANSGQDFSSPLNFIYIFASYDDSEYFNTGSSVQLAEHTISGSSGTYRGFAFVGTFGARYLKLGGNVNGTGFSACEVKFMRFNQGM